MINPPPGDDQPGVPEHSLIWPDGSSADLAVPDDIADLTGDIEAWRAERSRARSDGRRAALSRWIPRRLQAYGATAPLLIVSMLLLGGLSAGLVLFGPRGHAVPAPTAAPLATTTVPVGRRGGLLPDVTVTGSTGVPVRVRDLQRPATIVLLPPGCAGCAPAVRHALAVSEPYGLPRYVVGGTPAEVRDYESASPRPVQGLVDADAVLRRGLADVEPGPALVLVASDGTISGTRTDLKPDSALNELFDRAGSPSLAQISAS